jgi:hypothetical protein
MQLAGIQKRSEVVYGRVKPINKEWLADEAAKKKISEAEFLDDLLDIARSTNARTKKRPSASPKAARKRA